MGPNLFSALLLALAIISFAQSLPTKDCPILGLSLPPNFNISNTNAIRSVISTFPSTIEALFSSGTINRQKSSFALDVFSTTTNESIYRYYHSAPDLEDALTAGVLNEETMFRIGSVSKLYTAYAIVAAAGGLDVFDHAVVEYIPELAGGNQSDPIKGIRWEDVTIGALASMQAGTGGFPIIDYAYLANTTESFLEAMRERRPSVPVFQTALYSDAGYAMLGLVLERMTGLTYDEALQKFVSDPLGLNHTTSLTPAGRDVNGLAIPGTPGLETAWGYVNEASVGSGGLYSNLADFRRTGLSILNSELLSPPTTQSWLKPRSGTASLVWNVGAPWEINRLEVPVSAKSTRTRVSDLYTKSGGNTGYGAILALSPDHGLGLSILVAGANALADRWPLRDAVGDTFIPAAEVAAGENARLNYAGTFVDEDNALSNLTLTVNDEQPGLGLESFYMDGVDWRANTSALLPLPGLEVRLYPTGPVSVSDSPAAMYAYRGSMEMAFRAVATVPSEGSDDGSASLFDNSCLSWFDVSFFDMADEFVFEVVDGRVERVRSMLTGVWMKRVD